MHTIGSNSIWIIMILLIIITRSAADPKQCTPKAADKKYEDVTFVFVFNHYDSNEGKDQIFHVMSQIVCQIPIADNIKTYLMYYGAKKLPEIEDEDFVNSKDLLKKLQAIRDITEGSPSTDCDEFRSKVSHFTDSEKLKGRKDLYYIDIVNNFCPEPSFSPERLHILFKSYESDELNILSSFGVFSVQSNLNIALVDVRRIYEKIVQDGLRVVPSKTEEASNGWIGYLIGGIIGLLVGGALVAGGCLLHKKIQKKKGVKNKPPGKSTASKKKPSKK